jgi:hypothetical protein
MKKLLLLVPVILLIGTLAGCSVGPLPGSPPSVADGAASTPAAADSTPVASAPTPTTDTQATSNSLNVCKAVTVGVLNLLTGRHYVTATPLHSYKLDGCSYFGSNPKTLEFTLTAIGGGHTELKNLVKYYGQGFPTEPVPNLGDEAYDITEGIIVRYGDTNFFALDGVAPATYRFVSQQVEVEIIRTLRAAR